MYIYVYIYIYIYDTCINGMFFATHTLLQQVLETRSSEAIIPNFHQNYLRIVLPSAMATITEVASGLRGHTVGEGFMGFGLSFSGGGKGIDFKMILENYLICVLPGFLFVVNLSLYCLVGGLEPFFIFPYILGIIIPTDSYFSEELKPPTSCGLRCFFSQSQRWIVWDDCPLHPDKRRPKSPPMSRWSCRGISRNMGI